MLLVLLLGRLGAGIEPPFVVRSSVAGFDTARKEGNARDGLGDGLVESGLVVGLELFLEVSLDRVAEVVGVRLESVLGGDASGGGLVLSLVLLSLYERGARSARGSARDRKSVV